MSKPVLHFQSRGQSGNIYWLLGAVYANFPKEEYEDVEKRVKACKSYEDALKVIGEKFTLIDDDGVYE